MTALYWLGAWGFSGIAKLFYRHKVEGMENWVSGGAILAANHSSYFDPLFIAASLPEKVLFLAKTPLFRFPFFAKTLHLLDTIPLNQKDASGLDLARKKLEEGYKVVMFPEGQRSFDGKLLAFKEGAAELCLQTGLPILPIYIEGAHDAWPRGKRFPRVYGKTLCRLGKPIWAEPFSHLSKKEARKALTATLFASLHARCL